MATVEKTEKAATMGESEKPSTTATPSDTLSPSSSSENLKRSSGFYNARSYRLSVINWWNVYLQVYAPYVLLFAATCLVASAIHESRSQSIDLMTVTANIFGSISSMLKSPGLVARILAAIIVIMTYIFYRERPVYIVDFATFRAPEHWKYSKKKIVDVLVGQDSFSEEAIAFQERVMAKSGNGDATAWPPQFADSITHPGKSDSSMKAAREESETVMIGCIDDLIKKTGVDIRKIDFLIVNCSCFCPTPSLCALVANHYHINPDVRSYNLGGMGCSAGAISIELASQLLSANPGSLALVVSFECITPGFYYGKEKGMLLQNTLFRSGGAAILLSNKWADGPKAKYKMLYAMRTLNSTDEGYRAIYQCEDQENNKGIALSKEIVNVAGRTMKQNLTKLGPYILPLREQAKALLSMAAVSVTKAVRVKLTKAGYTQLAEKVPRVTLYLPDFTTAVDHFCIHTGGRGVLDGIEKNLGLAPAYLVPSRTVLYRYGNTSSSSIWYELEYAEENCNMQAGHRVLQIAFGSGFKCNSVVWLRLRK